MAFAFKATIDIRDAMRRLNGIKTGKKNRILRTAATKAARLLARAAKANLRDRRKDQKKDGITRTGQLRLSIGSKVETYGDGIVVALIGPRRGFRIQVGTRTRDGKKGKAGDPIYHDPANVAHLVEYGHKGPSPAPAYPFMRPAWEQNKSAIERIYRDEINAGIQKLALTGSL